jgi:hypothetical protein
MLALQDSSNYSQYVSELVFAYEVDDDYFDVPDPRDRESEDQRYKHLQDFIDNSIATPISAVVTIFQSVSSTLDNVLAFW